MAGNKEPTCSDAVAAINSSDLCVGKSDVGCDCSGIGPKSKVCRESARTVANFLRSGSWHGVAAAETRSFASVAPTVDSPGTDLYLVLMRESRHGPSSMPSEGPRELWLVCRAETGKITRSELAPATGTNPSTAYGGHEPDMLGQVCTGPI